MFKTRKFLSRPIYILYLIAVLIAADYPFYLWYSGKINSLIQTADIAAHDHPPHLCYSSKDVNPACRSCKLTPLESMGVFPVYKKKRAVLEIFPKRKPRGLHG
ncbi:MAG: hypothetical protein ABIG11_01290 [bacterium]